MRKWFRRCISENICAIMIGWRGLACTICFLFLFVACQTKRTDAEKLGTQPAHSPSETSKEYSVHVIEIRQMKFEPAEIRVKSGDHVRWTNKDITYHDVTERSKSWASSPLATGESWSLEVTETVDYYCDLHQVMKGRIVVE